jgi:hypothetical protein
MKVYKPKYFEEKINEFNKKENNELDHQSNADMI